MEPLVTRIVVVVEFVGVNQKPILVRPSVTRKFRCGFFHFSLKASIRLVRCIVWIMAFEGVAASDKLIALLARNLDTFIERQHMRCRVRSTHPCEVGLTLVNAELHRRTATDSAVPVARKFVVVFELKPVGKASRLLVFASMQQPQQRLSIQLTQNGWPETVAEQADMLFYLNVCQQFARSKPAIEKGLKVGVETRFEDCSAHSL